MEQKGNWAYTDGPEQLRDREKEGSREGRRERGKANTKQLDHRYSIFDKFPF